MNQKELNYEDVLKVIEIINSASNTQEFKLRYGEVEIEIQNKCAGSNGASVQPAGKEENPAPVETQAPETNQLSGGPTEAAVTAVPKQESAPNQANQQQTATITEEGTEQVVKAPMVGSFYRAPEPGADPFVEVGQKVKDDDTVCLIEVMKLFSSIPAGVEGTVTEILVEDGEAVEYGQPLMIIK